MHPVFPLIISVGIFALILNTCLIKQKVNKTVLLLTVFNVFVWVFITAFYEDYIKDSEFMITYYVYSGLVYAVFLFISWLDIRNIGLINQHYSMMTSAFKNTKANIFYTVDKKERLLDISVALLDELGLPKNEVLGRRIFDVFDQTIRFTKINDVEVNNNLLREYYSDYKKKAQPRTEEKLTMQFQNYQGKTICIKVVERPVFISRNYKGRIVVGEKHVGAVVGVEKEMIERNNQLESIRYKFIAALELTEEGLFFNDLRQQYIWGTDAYVRLLGLPANTVSTNDFHSLMHPDDFGKYRAMIEALSEDNPRYSIAYRYQKQDRYVWIKETGKRIFDDENEDVVLGFVKSNEVNNQKSETGIDSLKDEVELLRDLSGLITTRKYFELVIIKLVNIPEINEKYNRSVGTMMMNEYVEKLRQGFVSESSDIYRINGLEFALTITDVRKIDMFKKLLESDGNSMNIYMEYGSIKEMVKVKIGVAIINDDADNETDLLKCAKTALKIATSFDKNYCFHKDIR